MSFTFPIDVSYTSFNSLQSYLDSVVVQNKGKCVGTVIEYSPGEFGLVAAINIKKHKARDFSQICFKARNSENVINLEPVIVCQRTNLIILKAKKPKDKEKFKTAVTKVIALADKFDLKDGDKIKFYQKDLFSFNDVVTTMKAKRFRFQNYFGFFLSQTISKETDLTEDGPILTIENKLIGVKLAKVKQIISAFHIQYLCQQISSSNYQLMDKYPILPLDLINIDSKNRHLYLPETSIAAGHAFGALIKDCPEHQEFPLKKGDVIVAINDKPISMQHIEVPPFGKVNIDASALLSTEDDLKLTIYREKQNQEFYVSKKLLSRNWTRMKSKLKFIIMNAIVFQSYNSHLQSELSARAQLPDAKSLDPKNVHSLSKSRAYIKQKGDEIVIIKEILTHSALFFGTEGSPMAVTLNSPFVVRELNGHRIRNLKSLIKLMSKIPVGSPFILSGSVNDRSYTATSIKLSPENNEAILIEKAISNSCSPSLKKLEAKYKSTAATELHPDSLMGTARPALYNYSPIVSTAASSSSVDMIQDSKPFNIKRAEKRGLLFLYCTTKIRSTSQPYQYSPDRAGTGTGFLFSYRGKNYIATCAHVLGYTKESSVRANFPEHTKDFNLTPLIINNEHDLAILQVESEQEEFDALAYPFIMDEFPKIPAPQTNITILGFPGVSAGTKTNPKSQTGKLITAGYMVLQYNQQALVIQTNAATTGGNSGGPVIDSKTGRVIGIHSNGSTRATLVNLARPAVFLAKMLKHLDEPSITTYPKLPGVPFILSGMTDSDLKRAYGLEPSCVVGARIDRLFAVIPGLEAGDILVELIDATQQGYPVNGKCNINLFGYDMLYKAFFEMHNPGDTVGFKIVRDGKESIVTAVIEPNWKSSPYICDVRKDSNQADFMKLSDKLVLATMDWEILTGKKSNTYSFYHGTKLRNPAKGKESKVVWLEILRDAINEIPSEMAIGKKLKLVNRINGQKITSLDDVRNIISNATTNEFEFEIESNASMRKEIFRITINDETKAACTASSAAPSSPVCSSSSDYSGTSGLRF